MSGRAVFVAGAHTDIGKTHVACALIRAARARGLACDAFKPVMSGFTPTEAAASDAGRLLQALGRPLDEIAAVSPLRFAAPLAPPLAARREGVRLEMAMILDCCRTWLDGGGADFKLLEGAGGLMSPIAEDGAALGLPEALGLPAILVSGAYLGAISHALTAVKVMRARDIPVRALVVSEDAAPGAPDFAETLELMDRFTDGAPIVAAARGHERWADTLLDILLA